MGDKRDECIQRWIEDVKETIRAETVEKYKALVLDDIKYLLDHYKIDNLKYENIEAVLKCAATHIIKEI